MKLKDICEFIIDCPHSTAKDEGEGYPLIRTPNIGKGRLLLEEVHRVSADVYKNRTARGTPQDDDLILAREAPIGNVAIIKNGIKVCLGQRTVLIRPDKNRANPDFLVYYLLSPEQQGKLKGYSNGATVNHLNMVNIRSLDINIPNIKVQNRIASILSAYDDLIENNQKQIKLLEEAAQRLYKEWFVDLRFPGHEDVEFVDGLPKGWEVKKLGEVCETYGGGTPSTKESSYYDNGNLLWVTPTDITKNNSLVLLDTEKKITEEGFKNSSAKMLPEECILMTSRASVGYFGICERSVCTNQGFISCVPNKECFQMYLLYNLLNRVEEIRQKAGGSTYLEISKKTFRDFDIILPDIEVLKEFQKLEHKILEETRSLSKKIVCLKEARDRLLSKLMSGEVEV